jgi:two-component system NtrC family response regulator
MPCVLIIDNDDKFTNKLSGEIIHLGHDVMSARTIAQGFELANSCECDVVFLNADMPDGRGIDALPGILETACSPEVIIVADSGDPDEAEQAVKMGAWDYVERPASPRAAAFSLVRAMQYRAAKIPGKSCTLLKGATEDIVGSSTRMKQCLKLLMLAANGDANVLITGETGTGKELFAKAIHDNSSRADGKFVVVDCAALPETLVESILFGFEKGAFTGADRSQMGLIKRADGGTLFLDEVGELPLSVQKSFLRVLQERRFRQVGGGSEIRSDFRLIAASNRNLERMVRHHQFRKDLLFRLRAFTLELPPLRDRLDDIREIAAHHVGRLCKCYGLEKKDFSPDFFEVLDRYGWPGNVRELVNAMERAVSAAKHEPVIFPKHLPINIRISIARASVGQEINPKTALQCRAGKPTPLPKLIDKRDAAIAEVEQQYLKELMALTDDMQEACCIAGLSRSRLYALLKKYNLPSCYRNS